MTLEEIKKLETEGARKILIDKLIATSDQLSEVCGRYARINPDSWGAKSMLKDYIVEIKLHSNTILTLINHLESGT